MSPMINCTRSTLVRSGWWCKTPIISFHIIFISYPDSSIQPIRHDVCHVVVFVTTHLHDETGDYSPSQVIVLW